MAKCVLDVDFLISPFMFDRHVVYRMDTGVLRNQVLAALTGVSRPLAPLDERAPIQAIAQTSYGLFGDDFTFYRDLSPPRDPCRARREELGNPIPFADMKSERRLADLVRQDGTSAVSRRQRSYADDIIEALKMECGSPAVLLADRKHALFRHPEWASARDRCLVIEEAVPTEAIISRIVSFLEKTSELLNHEGKREDSKRHSYLCAVLAEGINDRSVGNLRDAIHVFDEAVLLYSDVKTGAFSAPQGKTGRFDKLQRGLGSELRAFLIKPHQHSQTALLDTIVRLHGDGAASRSIVEKLCRATLRMMNTRLSRNRRPRGPSAVKSDRALIWACLLLIGCDCLIAYEDRGDEGEIPGTFAARVDEMLRSFSIAIASKVSDPFHGQWSNLRRLFAKHANAEGRAAFSQLMSEIPESVAAIDQDGRQWLSKMEAMIHAQRRVKRSYEPSPAQRLSDIMPDPGNGTRQWETLHTILGNERTIGQLKQRFASENHAPPILLHGPRGTGKHTIARAYARTFLCYNREAGSDQPCGHCAPCTDLAHDHGFIDFNASADLDGARGREVSRRIGAGLYPHRRVVIIQNAGPREETLDALLSKLESFASDTAILLCMPDIAVVEPAITSRCAIYRVRPLVEKHASALIYRLMPALGARVPEASAVALMVTQSEGNPERIHALAQRAAVARATSLSQMRIAIDGGWSEWSMNLWSALVSQTARAAPIPPLPAEKSSAEAFSHAANGLVMLQREEMPSTPKRIFDEALNEKRRTTLVKLRDLAEQMGVPQDELWCRLAFIWTSDAHASSADFKEAIKATMRLLHPQFV